MASQMRIDVICDLVCPWCVIALRRLHSAIEELQLNDYFKIECHPLRVYPKLNGKKLFISDFLSDQYGYSELDLVLVQDRIASKGEAIGFDFDFFHNVEIVDTTKAHILLDYAQQKDKQFHFIMNLYRALLSEQKNISDINILENVLIKTGLNSHEGLDRLKNCENERLIASKEQYWRGRGVNTVPTIYFNGRSTLTGAMPKNVYKNVLKGLLDNKCNSTRYV